MRDLLRPIRRASRRVRNERLLSQIGRREIRRVVVGSRGIAGPGWIPSDREQLDLLDTDGWARYFPEGYLDAILAEHVWEHLTATEGLLAAQTCYQYLKPGGYLRVAVPDGRHPDPEYIGWVKPGGNGSGADDHKMLYTADALSEVFELAGFRVELLEYFDENGRFHHNPWLPEDGMVQRTSRFDRRNRGGTLRFTSLMMDAHKPAIGAGKSDPSV